jgi:myo-inositol-1(or 4)-monophosphatase
MAFDLDTAITKIKQIARQAGAVVMKHFESGALCEATKLTVVDIVTIADKESDEFIRSEFGRQFPGYGVITEEADSIEPSIPEKQWLVVDPLDGTTNYSCNCPFFSISIGLIDSEYKPLAGAVYDPVRDELFFGVKGKGSFVEKTEYRPKGDLFEKVVVTQRLKVSGKTRLIECLAVTGYHVSHIECCDPMIREASAILPKVRCLRALGSAALETCYVAAGRLDVYYECGCHIWDVAAGWVIATEAGCTVTDYAGKVWAREDLLRPKIELIFAAPGIHSMVVECLAPCHT